MKRFPTLSRKELHCIRKLLKKQKNANESDYKKHSKFIVKYCFENDLKELSFRRTDEQSFSTGISFYNLFDFMTPARRRDVEKQLEEGVQKQ